eukprot:2533664-Prymnesium_polylepis.1
MHLVSWSDFLFAPAIVASDPAALTSAPFTFSSISLRAAVLNALPSSSFSFTSRFNFRTRFSRLAALALAAAPCCACNLSSFASRVATEGRGKEGRGKE